MPSGRTIRLKYDIDRWLSSIDPNLGVALSKVKAGYVSHKQLQDDIISKLEDLEKQIENLKTY